jgi:hypothetical protein
LKQFFGICLFYVIFLINVTAGATASLAHRVSFSCLCALSAAAPLPQDCHCQWQNSQHLVVAEPLVCQATQGQTASPQRQTRVPETSHTWAPFKGIDNEKRGGLAMVSFERSHFKLFTLKFSNKSDLSSSCVRLTVKLLSEPCFCHLKTIIVSK